MKIEAGLLRAVTIGLAGSESGQRTHGDVLEVRQGAVPDDIEERIITEERWVAGFRTERGVPLPQLLAAVGLAGSRTDAERLLKSGAVAIDGVRYAELFYRPTKARFTVRAGKKWMQIVLQ